MADEELAEERTEVSSQNARYHRAQLRRLLVVQSIRESLLIEDIYVHLVMILMDMVLRNLKSLYCKTPYYTSILTGQGWVNELLRGHPERIRCELGVHRHVFLRLVTSLVSNGITDSRHVSIEEQLAIFLFTCVTGNSMRHVGERFQRSNDTISKYFTKILVAFSSAPFYTTHVRLPAVTDPVPDQIQNDPKFFPWFRNALGALDGTHILCAPSAAERQAAHDYKGTLTQNCLAICSFDMKFLYMYSGWEGSAADSAMFNEARVTDLRVPEGMFYLADAGFPACASLLVPYRRVRHHLQEWGQARVRPANPQELFNLRHASARNVIERIFGVLKRRFHILVDPPEIDLRMQARIPCALAAVHNFIRQEDPREIEDFEVTAPPVCQERETGELAAGAARPTAERREALELRDRIAQDMWEDYQGVLRAREGRRGAI